MGRERQGYKKMLVRKWRSVLRALIVEAEEIWIQMCHRATMSCSCSIMRIEQRSPWRFAHTMNVAAGTLFWPCHCTMIDTMIIRS
jgi:hypothetical protein